MPTKKFGFEYSFLINVVLSYSDCSGNSLFNGFFSLRNTITLVLRRLRAFTNIPKPCLNFFSPEI